MGVRSLLRTNFLLNPMGTNVSSTIDIGPNATVSFLSNGAEVTHNTGTTGNAYYAPRFNATSGTVYYGRVKLLVLSGTVSVNLGFQSTIGLYFGGSGATQVTASAGSTIEATFSATSDVTGIARLLIDCRGTGTGEVFKVVELIVSDQPNLTPYFDGSSWETQSRFYKWTGMVSGSSSQEYLIVPDIWSPQAKSLQVLKSAMLDTILGPNPTTVPAGDISLPNMKKAALEKVLSDNGFSV